MGKGKKEKKKRAINFVGLCMLCQDRIGLGRICMTLPEREREKEEPPPPPKNPLNRQINR